MHRIFFLITIICPFASFASADDAAKPAAPLPGLLKITWTEGPEYPLGIQDSAFAILGGEIISAGGFSRYPKDVVKQYPDAFEGQPLTDGVAASGFTGITFRFDPRDEKAGWTRLPNIPGPARQAAATVVAGDDLYAIGGFDYGNPGTYRETYRLRKSDGKWAWTKLGALLPWPVCEAAAVAVGEKIYLVGGADLYASPGSKESDFNSEAARTGDPVGRALLVLDTNKPNAGWRRLREIPGSPRFNTAAAAAGGKIYALGGVHRGTRDGTSTYCNVVDSWVYDPSGDRWTVLPDMPQGANRRAVTYADRYILLIGGFKYETKWRPDETRENVYSAQEKLRKFAEGIEDRVIVFDTKENRVGSADLLLDRTSFPMATVSGDTLYTLGGEGGKRLWHPATFQIGKIETVAGK